jgi:hypothetical protein
MGISNYKPNSRLAQAGVVPNAAARPASPYEGQVIFQVDMKRTLVWDGAGWVDLSTGTDNQPGLELVKTQTIGSAVSSVTVSDVFSAGYDNYKITISDGVGSTNILIHFRLGSTNSGYDQFAITGTPTSNTVTGAGLTSQTAFQAMGRASPSGIDSSIELFSPFIEKQTIIRSDNLRPNSGIGGWFHGYLANTTSYTDFTILTDTGTLTGGKIRVYGYRN